MALLGPRFCVRAFSSCGKRGPLFIMARGPLTTAASLVADHRLQTRRLSNCGSRAQLLCGMWDLPRPGLEPVSPALAGRLSTTAPPGKPWLFLFKVLSSLDFYDTMLPSFYPLILLAVPFPCPFLISIPSDHWTTRCSVFCFFSLLFPPTLYSLLRWAHPFL